LTFVAVSYILTDDGNVFVRLGVKKQ